LWSSEAFGFVELDDAYCTGSSMMPQKKNPDVLELIRGKAGSVFGDLQALLVLMKGLPLTYQRDMQEDKVPLFHAVDTVQACLSVFTVLLASVRFQADRMREEAEQGFLNATDLADHLVRKGMPFRQAHAVAGRAVRHCLDQGKRLEDLTDPEWKVLAPEVGSGVKRILGIEQIVEARNIPGGTARRQVRKQLRQAGGELRKRRDRLAKDRSRPGQILL
jgi:argininosuccinate lyase